MPKLILQGNATPSFRLFAVGHRQKQSNNGRQGLPKPLSGTNSHPNLRLFRGIWARFYLLSAKRSSCFDVKISGASLSAVREGCAELIILTIRQTIDQIFYPASIGRRGK
jgi:hypothetical protein